MINTCSCAMILNWQWHLTSNLNSTIRVRTVVDGVDDYRDNLGRDNMLCNKKQV